ncbi:MAG: sulfurtransferase TusA family protein [Pseudomonadota bacterium]
MDDAPELDALGLLCPLPVLKLRKRLAPLAPGEVLSMVADDPAAAIDVPHFCQEQGHTLLGVEDLGFPKQRYQVRKG